MPDHLIPTLAAINEIELIVAAIGVIILFGNWVAKRLKEGAQKQQQDQQARSKSGLTLEEMAKRRREQLRSLSRSSSQSQAQQEPSNLAAGEAQQRQQAKTLYERRAEALRRAREQRGGERRGALAEDLTAQRQQEAQTRAREQQEMERRAREEAEAQQRQQREREAAEKQRRMQHLADREKQQEAARRRMARQRQQTLGRIPVQSGGESTTRRTVEDADSSAYAIRDRKGKRGRATWVQKALHGRESLRRAVVLAEVIAKPVSMRELDERI